MTEREFVIKLPADEIQRRIKAGRQPLEELNRQVAAFHTQPRDWAGQEWLRYTMNLIQQHLGRLCAFDDAQTLRFGAQPEEYQSIQERVRRSAEFTKYPWLSLPEEEKRFLAGYKQGMFELSLKPKK